MNTLLGIAIAIACTLPQAADSDNIKLKADLSIVVQRTIFFGHQSVGENILDGIQRLSAAENAPIRISQVGDATNITSGTFAHKYVERNGEPLRKLQDFERSFNGPSSNVDIALLKFCYVDFDSDTDVHALFESYRATIGRLRKSHPNIVFIHITAPLTVGDRGMRGLVKKLIGRSELSKNQRREEYNNLLRATYSGREPLFDLALVESSTPNGEAITESLYGNRIPVLASYYTSDGGHLNDTGKFRAARELISLLASIRTHSVPAAATHY